MINAYFQKKGTRTLSASLLGSIIMLAYFISKTRARGTVSQRGKSNLDLSQDQVASKLGYYLMSFLRYDERVLNIHAKLSPNVTGEFYVKDHARF